MDHVHIALTDSPTREMSILWHTMSLGNRQKHQYVPTVLYGTESGKYMYKKNVNNYGRSTFTYHKSVGYTHWILLDQLTPDTLYFYRCGDPYYGWSVEYSFKTAPSLTERKENINSHHQLQVYIYGDMGLTDNLTLPLVAQRVQNRVMQNQMKQHLSQFVVHIGDIGYADVSFAMKPPRDFEDVWYLFMTGIEPISAHVPYMVCPGNHEMNEHSSNPPYSINFTVYNSLFRMPGYNDQTKPHSMWYSFNYGNIHFVSISTETDFPGQFFPCTFGDQLQWLKNDLAAVNRSATPWVVVYGHRPIYSSQIEFSKNNMPIADSAILQKVFEQILHDYHVDLFMVGHVHSYERMYPIYQNKVFTHSYDNPVHTVYIVNGGAGCVEGLTPGSYYQNTTWTGKVSYKSQGYGILSTDIKSDKLSLKWQYFLAFDDSLDDEIDRKSVV